jgi:D-glycero-D-manno-heptose 1,7-bisphosphate phosphatase
MGKRSMEPSTVLLDRDGVILRNRPDYVKSWAEAEFIPGAVRALARMTAAGLRLVVVTNQSAVGRGLVSRETVDAIHLCLGKEAQKAGGRIDLFLTCPHMPAASCNCRKPRPGLLFEAQRQLGFELAAAFLVGDQRNDVLAARAAGCKPIIVLSGVALEPWVAQAGCPVVQDLAAAADMIIGIQQNPEMIARRTEWSMS